jgi:HK97 family phage prohead protease
METKNFFVTDTLVHETWGMKGKDQNYYVTGFISTDEVDLYSEVVAPEAMKSMIEQLKSGNIKLDVEHDTFKGKADIPIGRIVDAKMVSENGVNKIWVKATINKSHSKFQEVWKSIKDGFLDAFSIAYKPISVMEKMVEGANVKLLKAIELLNVAITGNPVNKGSRMVESFMKSVQSDGFQEENKMSEEEQPKQEEQPVEEKEEPKVEEPKEEVKEEESKPQGLTEEQVTKIATDAATAAVSDVKQSVAEINEKLSAPLDAIKSLNKEIAEMKSAMKKPVLKSLQGETEKNFAKKEAAKNPLDLF